jgi:hypothetical protein
MTLEEAKLKREIAAHHVIIRNKDELIASLKARLEAVTKERDAAHGHILYIFSCVGAKSPRRRK